MTKEPHPSLHDREWIAEVVDEYLSFDLSEKAAFYRGLNIDTLMSAIPVPSTKSATHCPTCRKKHVQERAASYLFDEIEVLRKQRRAEALTDILVDAVAGELRPGYRLLSEEEIQIGSFDIDYKPTRCGVYFLLDGGRVVYVGQAKNVNQRLKMHKIDPDKAFDSYAWVACEEEHLDTLEALYIMSLRPALNKRQPNLYAMLERTKKLPRNLALPDAELIATIAEQESEE